jgi:hypothetical protein
VNGFVKGFVNDCESNVKIVKAMWKMCKECEKCEHCEQ